MAYEEWGMENWFDLSHTRAAQLMLREKAPWEALLHLADWIREEGKRLPPIVSYRSRKMYGPRGLLS